MKKMSEQRADLFFSFHLAVSCDGGKCIIVFSSLGLCAGTHKWKLVLVTSRKYSRHPTCTALIILSSTAYSVKCVTLQGSYCLFRGNSICILENHLLFQTSYRLKRPSINKLANIFMIKKIKLS